MQPRGARRTGDLGVGPENGINAGVHNGPRARGLVRINQASARFHNRIARLRHDARGQLMLTLGCRVYLNPEEPTF